MPWSDNASMMASMPSLKGMPAAAISMMREVANKLLSEGKSDEMAMQVAWGVVKKKFKKEGDSWVARTEEFATTEYYTFDAKQAESFITRTEEGTELHNYVLSDVWPDNAGTAPTEELLTEWASWINANAPEADVDHGVFEHAKKAYGGDVKKVSSLVRSKKGIAKAVKAVVNDGQLIVSLAFDKRYKNYVSKVKGLSIEAAAIRDTLTNKFTKGELLGFTLAMNQTPSNPRAVRI